MAVPRVCVRLLWKHRLCGYSSGQRLWPGPDAGGPVHTSAMHICPVRVYRIARMRHLRMGATGMSSCCVARRHNSCTLHRPATQRPDGMTGAG